MAGQILPPNTALIDSRGRITREWYRYLTEIQTSVNSTSGTIDEAALLLGTQPGDFGSGERLEDISLRAGPSCIHDPHPDDLRPMPMGLMQEEADLRYNQIGGASSLNIRTVAATLTPGANDYTLLCDATGGAIVVNFPAAAQSAGRVLVVKKTDASANSVTIDPNGGELIDGAPSRAITTQYNSIRAQSDGAAWWII